MTGRERSRLQKPLGQLTGVTDSAADAADPASETKWRAGTTPSKLSFDPHVCHAFCVPVLSHTQYVKYKINSSKLFIFRVHAINAWRAENNLWESVLPTAWAPGMRLRLPGLAVGAFTYRDISTAQINKT